MDYFDGRMIGLTATPATFIDRDTFVAFECNDGKPTFLYSYKQAVDDKVLVDFSLYQAKTKFQRKGIRGVDLSEEERKAGPDDYFSRMKLEHLADKRNWFSARDKKDGSIVKYLPKRGFMSAAHKGAQEIGEKRDAVDSLLGLVRPLDTKRCEIIATLYAAWNDFLLKGKQPSDAEIVHDVLNNWRPEKRLILERRWLRGLKWMRDNGLVPTGRGRPVLHSSSE